MGFLNTYLLPLEVSDTPWLYENKYHSVSVEETGKWMLFYDNSLMNESWKMAKKLYRDNKLDGVTCMKCSTAYENHRASTLYEGVIILYCNKSSNEEKIMNIGKKIIEMFGYKEKQIIYYKTDLQTEEGTNATGKRKNHTYKLFNPLYKGKCLINLPFSKPILPVEEVQMIERQHPNKRPEKPYPKRYDYYVFEKLNKMNRDKELQNNYKKWKSGINYTTNRKIAIGKKLHEKLGKKFMIHTSCGNILFDTLNNINQDEYLHETIKINNMIDYENSKIKDYNSLVDSIIEKIEKLDRWNEFIEFEGKCYGITSKVLNNIHIENNCFGEMIFNRKKTEYICNDRPFCNYDDKERTFSIFKCSKCNYENKVYEPINV